MPIIVYGIELSPPVRSVLLTAKAIGLKVELRVVDVLKEEQKTEDYLKKNPAHTIPLLEDDGFFLFESRAIMTYLVQKYGKDDKWYSKDVKKRAKIDNMLYFEGSTLFPSIASFIIPQIRLGIPADPEKEAIMIEKIGIINTILGQHPYFGGNHISIADLSLINTLTLPEVTYNFDFGVFPNIKKWMARIKAELPFYDEVTKPGLEQLKTAAKSIKRN